jgi:PAS domain S-box-containing protein
VSQSEAAHPRGDLVRATGAAGYAGAILVVASATALKFGSGELLGADTAFALFGLAIIAAGALGGGGPALLASLLSALVSWAFFVSPEGAFPFDARSLIKVSMLAIEGIAISYIVASMHAARARLATSYAQEVAARKRLEDLSELSVALSKALTRDEVSQLVVERGMSMSAADVCTLYMLDESDGSLQLIGQKGGSSTIIERIRRIGAESGNPVFRTIASGETLWAETERDYHRIYPELAGLAAEGPRAQAFWSVPLIAEGKPIGLLGMGFYQPRAFPREERAFVSTFARHCAEALRRAQRLQAEQAARAVAENLQRWLATTLRSIGDAVIATDERGNVALMNEVASQLSGWSEADARGRPLREIFRIINEHSRAEVQSPVEKVLRDGVVVGLANHTVLLHRDGQRETPIDDSGAPIRDEQGKIAGVVLVFRDISAKKREEAHAEFVAEVSSALAESLDYETTLAAVARLSVPGFADWCAVHIVDPDSGRIAQLAVAHVDPNQAQLAREMGVQYPPDPEGPSGVSRVLRDGAPLLLATIDEAQLQTAAVDEAHARILRQLRLGSAMVVPLTARERVLGTLSFVSADSGRRYGEADLRFAEDLARRCAVAIDNARLYASEQHARQAADVANHAKDEFLASISHELRTPLNAIMGWAKLMSMAPLDETKRKRAVETIERNAVAMAQLIEDLLDVSRIISGKLRIDVQPVQIARVIETAIESLRPAAEAREIRIVTRLDGESSELHGDPARLQQVVWNLLSNAVKFSERGGIIEVTAQRSDTVMEIRVSDTGKGIDPAFLPHVFDPFRQEDGSTRRTRGGLGLGLAIAKQLVDAHGGRIEGFSEGEGRGASFLVRLPLGAPEARSLAPAASRQIRLEASFERPNQLRGLRVLIVDDDDDARDVLRAVLEQCGSSVLSAASVEQAFAMLVRESPDVLISDIGMPGQDGYDLIKRVRALPVTGGGNIPAAALTAYSRVEDRRRVLSSGYSMHIPKPVEPAELVAAVAALARDVQGRADA